MKGRCGGHSIAELLVAVALLALLSLPSLHWAGASLARQRVETAIRRVALGLEQGRSAAQRSGRPCGLRLTEQGWEALSGGGLPSCLAEDLALVEESSPALIRVDSWLLSGRGLDRRTFTHTVCQK